MRTFQRMRVGHIRKQESFNQLKFKLTLKLKLEMFESDCLSAVVSSKIRSLYFILFLAYFYYDDFVGYRFDFQRFGSGKLHKDIAYPETLNIRPYMSDTKVQ